MNDQTSRFLRCFYFQGYLSGMGYIFSYQGLSMLYEKLVHKSCTMDPTYEDQSFGKCLADIVLQLDTRDVLKRQTFLHDAIDSEIAIFNEFDITAWIKSNSFYHFKNGLDCCSAMLVGTHHINLELMFLYNHLIRNVTIWGKNKSEHEPRMPNKLTRLEIAESALDVRF